MKPPPSLSRWIAAGVLAGVWTIVALLKFVALQIVSHEDDWGGWVDLWPVCIAYGAGTAILVLGLMFLLRPRAE